MPKLRLGTAPRAKLRFANSVSLWAHPKMDDVSTQPKGYTVQPIKLIHQSDKLTGLCSGSRPRR